MVKPNVSVIVPVYNVEKYLKRCIDSLINQTLKNIEIILVDDGSPDKCPKMCDEYAKLDSRIKVIHKDNGGLGLARNSGLEIATGEFVGFVDSDDYVSVDMYEKLYNAVNNSNAHACYCGCYRMKKNGTTKYYVNPLKSRLYTGGEIRQVVLASMIGATPEYHDDVVKEMSSCMSIYSIKLLKENNIKFSSERQFISEDMIFNFDFCINAKLIASISDTLYYYCENDYSLTTTYRCDRFQKVKIQYFEMISKSNSIHLLNLFDLRINRTFIGDARVCIIQEVYHAKVGGIANALGNIYKICADANLHKVLKEYPINKLPFKQRVFGFFMKINIPIVMYILVKLK